MWVVAIELIVAMIALAMAGRLVRAVLDLDRLDFGFQAQGVLTMDVRSSGDWNRFYEEQFLPRVRALPGVVAAGAAYIRPLRNEAIGLETSIMLEGQSLEDRAALNANPLLNFEAATSGYFEAAGIAARSGRVFGQNDRATSPLVVIVGERAAAALWPGKNAVGRRVLLGEDATRRNANGQLLWRTVVGVVKDVHYRGITDVRLDIYVPATQSSQYVKHLLVRTTGDPLTLAEPIRRLAQEIDSGAQVQDVATMPRILYDATRVWRLTRTIAIAFGALAILIAGIGLYALLAQAVVARRYELAVRAALGARPVALSRLVLRDTVALAALATSIGVLAAVPVSNMLTPLDVTHTGTDASALAIVIVLLLIAAIVASVRPAIRAAQTAPAAVLRQE
jgi:hypothetical protein